MPRRSRPLPEVEKRRIDDESGRLALSDFNAVTYDLPTDWVRGVVAVLPLWFADRTCLTPRGELP